MLTFFSCKQTEEKNEDLTSLTSPQDIMPLCYAFGCNNTSKNSLVSFHSFPLKKPGLLKQWLANFNRDVIPTKNVRLCSDHFEADCFKEDLYGKYVGRKPGERVSVFLKDGAVPTIFKKRFPKSVVKQRDSSVKRAKAKQHREVSCLYS